MTIGIITTSRADFGIYLPLIQSIQRNTDWKLVLFVSGMHLSKKFGLTLKEVEETGIEMYKTSDYFSALKDKQDYSRAMAGIAAEMAGLIKAAAFQPDLLFVLGDRFEMFAAVSSLLPLNIKIAHLHGGEDSLGALDQKYRNAITCLSDLHFTSTAGHAKRVSTILSTSDKVFNCGALGVEAIKNTALITRREFEEIYGLRPDEPFVLSTLHPETVHDQNHSLVKEYICAMDRNPNRIICTLPNADQQADIIRQALLSYAKKVGPDKFQCFENLGFKRYYSAMKYCKMLIGNSSSGIIEAASFNKLVINIGDRQKGRTAGKNVYHVPAQCDEIIEQYNRLSELPNEDFINPYGDGQTSIKIIAEIKKEFKLEK